MEYRSLIIEYMKRVEREMSNIHEEREKEIESLQQQKVYIMNESESKLDAARHTMDTLNAILSEMERPGVKGPITKVNYAEMVIPAAQGVRGHIPKVNYADMNNMTHGECIEHIKKHEFGQ